MFKSTMQSYAAICSDPIGPIGILLVHYIWTASASKQVMFLLSHCLRRPVQRRLLNKDPHDREGIDEAAEDVQGELQDKFLATWWRTGCPVAKAKTEKARHLEVQIDVYEWCRKLRGPKAELNHILEFVIALGHSPYRFTGFCGMLYICFRFCNACSIAL